MCALLSQSNTSRFSLIFSSSYYVQKNKLLFRCYVMRYESPRAQKKKIWIRVATFRWCKYFLHCIWEVIMLISGTNLSTSKMQCHAENACANEVWQLRFSWVYSRFLFCVETILRNKCCLKGLVTLDIFAHNIATLR